MDDTSKTLPERVEELKKNYEPDKTASKMGAELIHMEEELAKHGLTIADLLRSVAKHFHGVTLPVYIEPKQE